jgi:dimethylargininase
MANAPIPPAAWTRPLSSFRRLAAAIVIGFVAAGIVHLANVAILFIANGSAVTNIAPLSGLFGRSFLVLFILLALAVGLGVLSRWWIAALVGLVAGIVAVYLGVLYANVANGNDFGASAVYSLGPIVGIGLTFVLLSALLFPLVGSPLWAWWFRVTGGTPKALALVRQPSARLAEGQVTHIKRTKVDPEKADKQWDNYVQALEANGFELVDVAEAADLPDSVFVEDAVVVLGGTAVIARPGAESRREETDAVRATAKNLGLKVVELEFPATLDGGDVLEVGSTLYVGRSSRTNTEGVAQLRAIANRLGYRVVAVPVTKALHLKSTVTALPDGTVIGFPALVDNPSLFELFLPVPEAAGAAVVVLGPDAVLIAASAPKTAELLASLGYRVVSVDVSEFEKLEGCVTCLSVRIP